jgi:cardiolipin synthase
VQVLASGPTYETNNNLLIFTNLFYYAQERVVIVTPYFIPDEALLTAIESAALRGVEIHLIVSQVADQFMVSRAQRSYYTVLMAAGVHIHMMRRPTLLHAKHLSIDNQIAVIGSSNLDMRSFQLNLEAMLIIYDTQVTRALQAIEYDYMRRSMELNLETWNKRPFSEQFLEDTLRLMSPLL